MPSSCSIDDARDNPNRFSRDETNRGAGTEELGAPNTLSSQSRPLLIGMHTRVANRTDWREFYPVRDPGLPVNSTSTFVSFRLSSEKG